MLVEQHVGRLEVEVQHLRGAWEGGEKGSGGWVVRGAWEGGKRGAREWWEGSGRVVRGE